MTAMLAQQMLHAVQELRDAMTELEQRSHDAAVADREWRAARAVAFTASEGTEKYRDAVAERETSELRYRAQMAEDLKSSAMEDGRSNRQIVSAFQSLVAASR